MDYYYNFNPDIKDSLSILNPSAQRNSRWYNRACLPDYSCAEDAQYMRHQSSFSQRCQRSSSTSLVLKKTTEREIVEEYYNGNFRYRPYPCPKISKHIQNSKHRPLIRVTVIPNNDNNTGTQTKLRKRRISTKKIQSSVSNHDSFFNAKNVFLVVAGKKREKVYEIKTTGSEYTNSARYVKDEEIPVEQNFQQLLNSLNMDTKKKKDKGKGMKEKDKKNAADRRMEDKTSATSLLNIMDGPCSPKEPILRDCICPPPIETVSPRKSRVRITGKIGITEDDRYVMRCAATVDGKPVETNFFQDLNSSPSPPQNWETQEMREIPRVCLPCPVERVMYCQREKLAQREQKVNQRDETVQTNIQYQEPYHQTFPCPAFMNTCPAFRSVETQCSPNNMNTVCFSNIEKLKIYSKRDEVVQCNCPQDMVYNSKNFGIEADYETYSTTPKSCNSPLVIISVYPKQDTDEKLDDELSVCTPKESNSRTKENGNANKKKEKNGKKKVGKGSRATSPTPSRSPVKAKEEIKPEKAKGKGKGKDKGDKQVKGNKKPTKKVKPTTEKKEVSKFSERRQNDGQLAIAVGRCAECCMGCVGNQGKGTNAQFNTKRIMNWVSAKNDVSNVEINIDGENEFYDVLFRQGDITTDLQVRKTIKEAQCLLKKDYADDGSLENFFLVQDDEGRMRKKSFSQTFLFDQPFADNTETLDPTVSRLKVRDSIEISHRREEKNSINMTSSASSSAPTSKFKLGHLKHFQGDSCSLSNPVERDKEIRELLGIEKPKVQPSRIYEEIAARAETDCKHSLHCLYRRHRRTNVSTVRNIHEVRCSCTNDADMQVTDDDGVDYIEDEFDSFVGENDNECAVYIRNLQEQTPRNDKCPALDNCPHRGEPCRLRTMSIPQPIDPLQSNESPRKLRISNKLGNSPSPCDMIQQWPFKEETEEPYEEETVKEQNLLDSFEGIRARELSFKEGHPPCYCDAINQSEERQPYKESRPPSLLLPKQTIRKPIRHSEPPPLRASQSRSSPRRTRQSHRYSELSPAAPLENPPLCQQLVMNRNINIYLQIEQFTKQKPIILSRKQYDKVKKTIESATAKKVHCICKSSHLSNGAMKKRSSLKTGSETDSPIKCEAVDAECCGWKKCFVWGKKKKKNKSILWQSPEEESFACTNCYIVQSDNQLETPHHEIPSNRSEAMKSEKHVIPTQTYKRVERPEEQTTQYYEPLQKYKETMPSNFDQISTQNNDKFTKKCNNVKSQYSYPEFSEKYYEKRKRGKLKAPREHSVSNDFEKDNNEKFHLKDDEVIKNQKCQKLRPSKKSKPKEEETVKEKRNDSKKESNHNRNGGGEESLEGKKSAREHKERKSEKETLRGSQVNYCKPTEATPKNDMKVPSQEAGSQEPKTPDTPTAGLIPRQHICKRCGRLRQLLSCGTCGRLNKKCVHTCFCYKVKENPESSVKNIFINEDEKYAASSTEVRYTSVIYANYLYRHVAFSSTNVADDVAPTVTVPTVLKKNYNSNSLHTIFKGRRKPPTPNLGTSAYSLYSEYSDATSSVKNNTPARPMQEKKPFLRRLMSCLVMRSKTSNVKIENKKPAPKVSSVNSSVDSYHINTSLGAIDLSSSIYDTSASFYSNHSIQPISSKIIKRGFLSSVRGFLTNRKT